MKSVIAIVGRPNVGKSTLFNRLTKTRAALVDDFPGLTRDRHYGQLQLGSIRAIVVDTGGFEPLIEDGIMYQMANQTKQAIIESDAVIFVVDGKNGVTPQDKIIANQLRKSLKPVFIAVNKVEGVEKAVAISDFYELGFTNLYPISSSHGDGVWTLIQNLTKICNFSSDEDIAVKNGIIFTVIGRPNVGKSTLVNTLVGEERVIVCDESGTTRDSIHISFETKARAYTVIDTAGIRRKGKVQGKIEKFSVIKALAAINAANVVVLVLDASLDIAEQDATIVGYALAAGKSIVIAVNKWDKLKIQDRENIKETLKQKLYFLDFAKVNYISALKKRGISQLLDSINEAYTSAFVKLSTPKLTRVLLEAVNRQPPPYKGKFRPKLRYAHQGGMSPPTIIIHGNSLEHVAKSYTKYLERLFRKVFNLVGSPLRIEYKQGENPFKNA